MDKIARRERRRRSIRKKVFGTSEKPRMCVHKSNKNLCVQIVDDIEGRTLCGMSTRSKAISDKLKAVTRKNMKFAEALGTEVAKAAVQEGITNIVFDRSGYIYHGVVKAIAEAARKNGLKF